MEWLRDNDELNTWESLFEQWKEALWSVIESVIIGWLLIQIGSELIHGKRTPDESRWMLLLQMNQLMIEIKMIKSVKTTNVIDVDKMNNLIGFILLLKC